MASPTLNQGDTGEWVDYLQRMLAHYEHPCAFTSVFDEDTHGAVIAFQTDNHLKPDGTVGPKTWAALAGEQPEEATPGHLVFAEHPGIVQNSAHWRAKNIGGSNALDDGTMPFDEVTLWASGNATPVHGAEWCGGDMVAPGYEYEGMAQLVESWQDGEYRLEVKLNSTGSGEQAHLDFVVRDGEVVYQ